MDEERFFRDETKKEKSDKQERKVAKETGGRKTINSGSLIFQKGDVEIPSKKVLIEAKRTDGKGMRIPKAWLTKLRKDAKSKIPVMHIEIDGEEWYMVRREEFFYILEKIEGGV